MMPPPLVGIGHSIWAVPLAVLLIVYRIVKPVLAPVIEVALSKAKSSMTLRSAPALVVSVQSLAQYSVIAGIAWPATASIGTTKVAVIVSAVFGRHTRPYALVFWAAALLLAAKLVTSLPLLLLVFAELWNIEGESITRRVRLASETLVSELAVMLESLSLVVAPLILTTIWSPVSAAPDRKRT